MNLRKTFFYTVDTLKGAPVRTGVLDLQEQFENNFKQADLKKIDLLEHAASTVPYYRNFSSESLDHYPVLDKRTISMQLNEFISSQYVNGLKKLHKATTSGSYGTPFTFYLNPEKRSRMVSEIYYFGRSSEFEVGKKHAYLVSKEKSLLKQFIQNQLMIPVKELNDAWCVEALSKINKAGVKVLVGYASAIDRLAYYLNSVNEALRMDGVITISEVLTEDARIRIEKAFLCSPVSRYSTEELGVLGNQDISGEFFYLNQCNYFIEVLGLDSNNPVAVGELGRIVVTDYYNRSMPLIRYDIGDLARPVEIKNGRVTKIDKVEGRRLSIIKNVKGEVVSSFQINGALRESREIVQFQFSQNGVNDYEVKLVVKGLVNNDKIISIYKKILGNTANIVITYVDDIVPLPSGKRPYIVQNYYTDAV